MCPWLVVDVPKIMISELVGWEKVTQKVVLKFHKVLTHPVQEIIACTFFQSEVEVVVDHTFYW